jgi:hypothetical protein
MGAFSRGKVPIFEIKGFSPGVKSPVHSFFGKKVLCRIWKRTGP